MLRKWAISRGKRAGRLISQGNRARDAHDWGQAERAYAAALAIEPGRAAIHVQRGHALKESGQNQAAEHAYREALRLEPDNGDTWLQLGHVLKLMGRAGDAVSAYAAALEHVPTLLAAAEEIASLGARQSIPEAVTDRMAIALQGAFGSKAVERLGHLLAQAARLVDRPERAYDAFRHDHPILPPPPDTDWAAMGGVTIRVEARQSFPAAIRASLESLRDQSDGAWRADVVADHAILDHPVASLGAIDDRIRFLLADEAFDSDRLLLMRAGTILDQYALAWFAFASARSEAAAIYCDHDVIEQTWRGWRRYSRPTLQPEFDPAWFETGLSSPAAILVPARWAKLATAQHDYGKCLWRISGGGAPVLHVPRLLASFLDFSAEVATAPPDRCEAVDLPQQPIFHQPIDSSEHSSGGTISIIIPTRDQAELLDRCVETLFARAIQPDRLELIIVDNRSREPQTADLLKRLQEYRRAHVLVFDEPFNWSRANNQAAAVATGEVLLFLNNDTEMLTQAWDALLADHLVKPDVGLVGARLLYEDRTLQHGGIIFGWDGEAPRHEGVGAAETEGGPEGRWLRTRSVGAVTGAFMALRRDCWGELGGFDEAGLPVGYSDVDMCLTVRAQGLRVLYAADLQLVHHESKTRGHNVTRSQIAWDRSELRTLYARWHDTLFNDPTLNPHWDRRGDLFHGYRDPPPSEIVAYLDAQLGRLATRVFGATEKADE